MHVLVNISTKVRISGLVVYSTFTPCGNPNVTKAKCSVCITKLSLDCVHV